MYAKLPDFIVKRYKFIIFTALILTIISLFLTFHLTLKTQMMDLLPKNDKLVTEYKRAIKNFNSVDNIIIGITGKKKDIIRYMNEISPELQKIPGVDKVIYKNNIAFLRKNGLILIKETDLKNMEDMFTQDSLAGFINGVAELFELGFTESEDADKLEKEDRSVISLLKEIENFIGSFRKNIDSAEISEILDNLFYGGQYYFSPSGKMALMFVKPSIGADDVNKVVKLVNNIESLVKEKARTDKVTAMITGLHVITRDEMETTEKDMNLTTILSLILILLLFYIGFRLIRYTIISFVPLIMGILWTLGLTYLFIGYLNIMTAMMAAILLGLGIDYAIHILSSFTREREKGESIKNSIKTVFRKTVGGVVLGALTTAFGFYLFGFSKFPGFRDFGIVLGTGILCTAIAYIFVFPAMLAVFGKKPPKEKTSSKSHSLGSTIIKLRWIIIGIVIVILISSVYELKNVKFENNMLKIEAKGLESIKLNNKIKKEFYLSADTSIAVTDTLSETRTLKKELANLSTIGEIDSIANYIPDEENQKRRMEIVNSIKRKLPKKAKDTIDITALSKALERLKDVIIELGDLAYVSGEENVTNACDEFVNNPLFANPKEYIEKNKKNIEKIQKIFIETLINRTKNTNSKDLITLSSLPSDIKSTYIGKNGKFLTTIYPKNDPWNLDFQKIYISQLKSLHHDVTGSSLIYLKTIDMAAKEGKKILIWTILLIYGLLLLDFRSLKYATIAMFPMLFSVITLLGIMGWLDIKFTAVNIIAIPLIIGIGVDDGIHLIHRYRVENDLPGTISGIIKAITFTTLTTISAFGTLMLAKYRGFVGFGLLLSLGVGLAYLYTLFLLPALIYILDKRKEG